MKKIMCLILTLLFVCSFAWTPVSAVNLHDNPEIITVRDETIKDFITEKAVEAFPEYESTIRGENLTANTFSTAAISDNPIVVQETRALSETESVSYTEYHNGIAVATFMAIEGKNVYQTITGSTYTTYRLNAWLRVIGSDGLLMVYDIECIAYNNGNNRMPDPGYLSDLTTVIATEGAHVEYGTASSPAYAEYSGSFIIEVEGTMGSSFTFYPGTLHIEITASGPTVTGY